MAKLEIVESSVSDPNPHDFGPPGFRSGSTSQRYGSGSGSFYHRATILRTVLWLLLDFLSLKNYRYINVPSKSNKQKNFFKISFLLASWRIMTKIAGSGSESGSISQRHGSALPDPDPHRNVRDPERRKIRLIAGNAKCCHLNKLTCKGTSRHVFIRVYRLEPISCVHSVMLVFSTQLWDLHSPVWPDPYYFIKDLKKLYRKSNGCLNPLKKVLISKKVP